MPLSALIFDFNGVLVDDEPVHFRLFHLIFTSLGHQLSRELYFERYFVHDDAGVFRHFFADHNLPLSPERLRELCADKAARYEALPDSEFRFFEGSEALARDAALHVPLAIASGARGAEIRRHLRNRGLAGAFRTVVSIDDVKNGKPDPEVYLEAARRISVAPAECVAIEDSPGGVEAARKAGMRTVAVTHSVPRERLAADVVVDSLEGMTWSGLRALLDRQE